MYLLRLILIKENLLETTLDQLRPGQQANIVRISGVDGIASRLREMGFVPGELVKFVRPAPLGDPLKCFVHGSRIAVRCGEARRVYVKPVG
jgi:Fe2+ transport system protein FeoA